MENSEAIKLLIEGKPRYLHKNKNLYVLIRSCKIKFGNSVWADGYIYINEEKPDEVYVRAKEDFESNFREFE